MRLLAGAFNAMASDLERHEKDRSEVLAGISHDLRTPLTRLRLEAEMSVADDGARQAVVADIEQMEAVISQFMDYARTDLGEEPAATDLAALLAGMVERQRQRRASDPVHRVELPELRVRRPRPHPGHRQPDRQRHEIRRRRNLGERLRQANEIWIEVRDQGAGIPAAETERLKRPFTRLDSARSNATGTGLGLAIVDRIARLHDGRLELLANPGGGLLARLVMAAVTG